MTNGTRNTVRNAVLVLVQRGAQLVGGVCFALVIPRLMGPEHYGRYALATSVAAWLALLSGLGLVNATTRYLPQLLARRESAALQQLIGNLFTLRVGSGLLAALLYVTVGRWWWHDPDPVVPLVMAAAVWAQGLSGYLFSIFLGFNQAGRWALGDTARRWLLVALVLSGYQLGGLRGAVVGTLLTEMTVLGLGFMGNPLLLGARHRLRPDRKFLTPYLRFGLASLATQVLLIAFLGSGEILVRTFSGPYAEVGYFSLAHNAYLMVVTTIPQIMLAFLPFLGQLHDAGQAEELARWSARLVRVLAATGVLGVFAAWFLGAAYVPLLFGPAYAPVAANLLPLSVAALAFALASVPSILALVHERPSETVVAAALRLVVFWGIAPLLVAQHASRGACLAVLAGASVHALYLGWRTRHLVSGSLKDWALPAALGSLFLPLALFRTGRPTDLALWGAGALVYCAALVLLRVVTLGEISAVAGLLRRGAVRSGEPEAT
jgi:O-antigen/teichoic acid export membrane protein